MALMLTSNLFSAQRLPMHGSCLELRQGRGRRARQTTTDQLEGIQPPSAVVCSSQLNSRLWT